MDDIKYQGFRPNEKFLKKLETSMNSFMRQRYYWFDHLRIEFDPTGGVSSSPLITYIIYFKDGDYNFRETWVNGSYTILDSNDKSQQSASKYISTTHSNIFGSLNDVTVYYSNYSVFPDGFTDAFPSITNKLGNLSIKESKEKIKRILREDIDKREKYIDSIVDYLVKKTYEEMHKTRTDVLNYWDRIIDDARKMFGLNFDAASTKIENEVFDRWISIITELPKKGKRVKLIFMDDQYTNLKKGDEGTVVGYNPSPYGWQIRVKWDDGSNLDLLPNVDEFEVLS